MLHADVGYYVPNRMSEGYGLNSEAMKKLADLKTDMVISVDCGISSLEPAQAAKELGMQLIITDHHNMADTLPDAAAIVHPRLPGSNYPFAGLCGAAVAFKLAWLICQLHSQAKKVSPRMKNYLMQAVGLAAIGTIADVVPLVDENRILVKHGLNSLKAFPTLGFQALMQVAGIDDKQTLDSEDIGFSIGPRINAAGRLGQAQLAIELLTTDNQQRATALAEYLHELNNSRQSLERSINIAANKQIKEQFDAEKDAAFVLASADWHAGVIGIVAGRLAEKYNRPVILIALDKVGVKPGVGSVRSAKGLDIHAALTASSEHLETYGGHAAAAGLKINEKKIDAFRDDFCEFVSSESMSQQRNIELRIDAEAPLSCLTLQTLGQLQQMAPFGEANRRPLFCTTDVRLAAPPKRMGGGGRHVSLQLQQFNTKLRAVAFGQGDWADELENYSEPIAIAYRPVINEFRGRRSVELQIEDWKPAEELVFKNMTGVE